MLEILSETSADPEVCPQIGSVATTFGLLGLSATGLSTPVVAAEIHPSAFFTFIEKFITAFTSTLNIGLL
jgi:hypothetical protein